MKKAFITITLAAAAFFAKAQISPTSITVQGSDAMYPVLNKLSGLYTNRSNTTGIAIKVKGMGSKMGILALLENQTDIASSTRKMLPEEIAEFKKANVKLIETAVAREAVTILINPKNPIYKLTKEQLKGIFTGKITNWKDVGGENLPIRVFIRGNSSGCYEGFKSTALDNLDYGDACTMTNSNAELKLRISQFDGAIGFLGFGDAVDEKPNLVKTIKVSANGTDFFEPSWENINGGVYPFIRDCYVYYKEKDASTEIAAFVAWLQKSDAQDVFKQFAFIPILK